MINKNLLGELKKSPLLFFLTVLLALLGALATVVEYWALASLIDGLIFSGLADERLKGYLFLTLVGLAVKVLCQLGSDFFGLRLSEMIQVELREALVKKMKTTNPLLVRSQSIGQLMTTYLEGVDKLAVYFHSYLPQLVKSFGIPICFLVFIFRLDLISGLVMVITLPLIPFFMVLIGKWTTSITHLQWKKLQILAAYLQDVLRGLETLKILGRSKDQGERIAKVSESYRVTTLKVQRWAFLSSLVLELVATLSIAIVAVGLGLRLVTGELSYLPAFFILLLAPEYYQPMRELGGFFHSGMDADEAAQDIYAFLQLPDRQTQVQGPALAFDHLEFKNVSYNYPGNPALAVEDISFNWRVGEKLALVGMSGSGKTTLLYLALGFIAPTAGEILLNGKPLKDQVAAWQAKIGLVPQDPYVFRNTIAHNIALEDQPDPNRVRQAAEVSGLTGLLADLPAGLETPVGQGVHTLSGGQTALLAISRVFYQASEVVFLDEPTDHLDLASEDQVLDALKNLLAGRSAFMIAHRLHTIRDADQVLVIDKGRLVERGTYDQLMARQGAFYALTGGGSHA